MVRQRGQITPRGDRKWLIRAYVGTLNGKRQYTSKVVVGTFSQAQRALTDLQRQIDAKQVVPREQPRMTLREYLSDRYWPAKATEVTVRTLRSYRDRLDRSVECIADTRLDMLTPLQVQHFVNTVAITGSPRTTRYAYGLLRSALKQAIEWSLLQRSPCVGIKLPRKVKRKPTFLTIEESQQMMQRDVLWTVALTTGMRPEEYLALEWSHVDLDAGVLRVEQALTELKAREWIVTQDLKTESSRRTVAIPASTVGALKAHRRATGAITGFVFRGPSGSFLSVDHARKRWQRDLKRAQIGTPARLYDTRHSHASHLLAAGVHPKVVQERLGHSSITITMDTYSHVMPELHKGTAGTVESLLFARKVINE